MPCYANTIVKVKCVRQNEKEDAKIISVWAIGTYPTGRETNELEIILFIPVNPNEQDPESQAIFRRDEYYWVNGKIIPGNYSGSLRPKMIASASTHLSINNQVLDSNKCSLNVSLVGVPQGVSTEIKNTEDSIIETLLTDYSGRQINYIVKVVFSHTNPRFSHLKTTIRPQESIIFVVGQMEIIGNEFYVYAKDISLIDTNFITKKKDLITGNNEVLQSTNPTRSRLLHLYQSMAKSSEKIPQPTPSTSNNAESTHQDNQPNDNVIPPVLDNIENVHQGSQPNNNGHSVKCKRSEEMDDIFIISSQTKKDKHVNANFENQSELKEEYQDEKQCDLMIQLKKNSTRNRK